MHAVTRPAKGVPALCDSMTNTNFAQEVVQLRRAYPPRMGTLSRNAVAGARPAGGGRAERCAVAERGRTELRYSLTNAYFAVEADLLCWPSSRHGHPVNGQAKKLSGGRAGCAMTHRSGWRADTIGAEGRAARVSGCQIGSSLLQEKVHVVSWRWGHSI